MHLLTKIIAVFLSFSLVIPAFAARQDLDEVMSRKSRYSTQSFYANEGPSPTYYWQSEMLVYTDTVYGTEVRRMTFKPDATDDYSNEYSTMAWSGDGSKLGFRSLENIRNSSDPNEMGGTTPRWTMNSDGSRMRAGTTLGGGQGHDYLNWLSTEKSSYLFTPRTTAEFSGADLDTLYKVVIDSSNAMARTTILANIGGNIVKSSLIKDPITSDDKWMILMDESAGDWPTPNDIDSYKLFIIDLTVPEVKYEYGVARGIGPTDDPVNNMWPDREVRLRGSSSAFINGSTPTIYAHYNNYNPHFLWEITGSDTDGGPQWEDWDGDSFGTNEEIKALDDNPEEGGVTTDSNISFDSALLTNSNISFDAASNEIRCSTSCFNTADFKNGSYITVSGSSSNNGTFIVTEETTTSVITVNGSLTNESAGSSITLSTQEIRCSTSCFDTDALRSGWYVVVSGSTNNDGIYLASSASTSVITVTGSLTDESAGDSISVSSAYPANPYENGYLGHPAFDRWGKYVLGDNTQDCGDDVRWGDNACGGHMILDLSDDLNNPSWVDANNTNYMAGTGTSDYYLASHGSWTAWSDWVIGFNNSNYDLYMNHYQKTNQTGKTNYQATEYIVSTMLESYEDNYSAFPRPSQSPDGTKVAFSTVLFASPYDGVSTDDDRVGISYVVAYYPYPPEIISVSSGVVRFDWRTDQTTSRGYTQRGWPNEATDDPPPPREIKEVNLWKSANGSTGWEYVGKTTVDLWSRYNYQTGVWSGNKYFEITDPDPSGYYAVTSVEHSGLESRTLSNVFSAAGTQFAAYPSDPGSDSDFLTTYNSNILSYRNVYAKDGSEPNIDQTTRVWSVPEDQDDLVDWLGNTAGTTEYVVTNVDSQGNESTAIDITVTHQKSPATTAGQYTIEFGDEPAVNNGQSVGAGSGSFCAN